MWLSSPSLRALATALLVSAPLLLAGCSGLRPVYGVDGTERISVRYAEPTNRLDRIIYQDLALRLGRSTGDAPVVRIVTSQSSRSLTGDTVVAAVREQQMIVTAQISVSAPDGTVVFTGARSATADYTTGAQGLANQQAADTAADRAARQLA